MLNETDTKDLLAKVGLFNWIEYTVFISLLGLSALIGIYYGWIKGTQNSKVEYMLGGKTMGVLPIAISLITSHVSGVTILGVPAEIYDFGIQYVAMCFSIVLIVYVTNKFYLPVFYSLQVNSLYEYLEMRFSKTVRAMISLLFALSVILHTPVVIYIPALAFNQVTGVSIHHMAPIVCLLCIFYTSIGGLKAVVWSDAIQSVFTYGAIISVIILGLLDIGGISKIIELNDAGGRLQLFNLNPSPLARNTFWTVTIGGFFLLMRNIACHPGSSQRFIALPTIEDAKRSVQIFGVGSIAVKLLASFIGLIIFAKYYSCDPIKQGIVKNSGQLVPHYVQDVARKFPGLTGVFIAGLMSGALSTMSADLNTLAGTLYEDFFVRFISKKSSATKANFIMKITVVCAGFICILMVYVVEHLKGILQVSISVAGVTGGSILAIFSLGIFYPWANTKGVIWGMITSVIVMIFIIGNAQLAIATSNLQFVKKPTFTSNCTYTLNTSRNMTYSHLTEITEGVLADKELFPIFALSYMYYSLIGCIIAIVVSVSVSYWTGSNDLQKLNPELITPSMRGFLPNPIPLVRDYQSRREYHEVMQEMDTYVEKIPSKGRSGTM